MSRARLFQDDDAPEVVTVWTFTGALHALHLQLSSLLQVWCVSESRSAHNLRACVQSMRSDRSGARARAVLPIPFVSHVMLNKNGAPRCPSLYPAGVLHAGGR